MLYEDLLFRAVNLEAKMLGARVREACEEGLRFEELRGFSVTKHIIEIKFDLKSWVTSAPREFWSWRRNWDESNWCSSKISSIESRINRALK